MYITLIKYWKVQIIYFLKGYAHVISLLPVLKINFLISHQLLFEELPSSVSV